jgi:solute carrier family 25 folate transporter 32
MSEEQEANSSRQTEVPEHIRQPPVRLNSLGHALSGMSASILNTIILYPLDVVKTRFQVHDGRRTNVTRYTSTLSALRGIFHQEGVRGLYKGSAAAILGASISWGIYLYVYNKLKTEMEDKAQKKSISHTLICGVAAGAVTAVMTNPIWVVKTRMQIHYNNPNHHSLHYKGLIDAFVRIRREEGFRAYYKGIVPALLASYHGAVQFAVYETVMHSFKEQDLKTGGAVSFVAGGLSKMAAMLSTHPLGVVKSRLQEQRAHHEVKYTGSLDAVKKIMQYEGFKGFYKGLGPSFWRLTFNSALFFFTYEKVKGVIETVPAFHSK